ncbi:MAG: PEP-CTERM sorting domain-containing protein, partial [Gemmataceae bacterium]|nr:PEP-CTERM sorting domain-containing protein [Gemmataceae bacterium]
SNAATPLTFKVEFALDVTDGSTSTTYLKLTNVGANSVTLNGNTYSVGIGPTGQWFAAPGPISASHDGAVTLRINVKPGGGEPHPSPEPSTMALGCFGLCCVGLASWRKRRNRASNPTEEVTI